MSERFKCLNTREKAYFKALSVLEKESSVVSLIRELRLIKASLRMLLEAKKFNKLNKKLMMINIDEYVSLS